MTSENRPDPDALLAEIAPPSIGEGRLKIFLGMCPGVGKTFAMLLAGQARQEEGAEVVIGVIETHGRIETTAIAAGLGRIPRKKFTHRGVTLEEMDLDAILTRKPQLALVDELAHSNAAGSRHPKRWQDVMELLQAGIDVYTTLNIQHIESQRDVVRQITGVAVHETVPDSVIDRADEIELIDLTPEQLRKRLEEGKVYLGERAVTASTNFFREGNLKALREIALRITAEKADRDLRIFMRSRRIDGPWRSRERFLVAVGGSPFSERLIRLARRAATAVHGTWIAVSVDTGKTTDSAVQTRLETNLALARSLGAEVILTTGTSIADALLRVSRENNVSQIIVGKPLVHPVIEWLSGGSLVGKLIRHSGDIDITVVRADKSARPWKPDFSALGRPPFLRELGIGALAVTGTTVLGMLLQPAIGYSTVGLLYLLAVLVSATVLSRAAILAMATLTAFAWNLLFIPPTLTFRIGGIHDTVLFGLYFVVASSSASFMRGCANVSGPSAAENNRPWLSISSAGYSQRRLVSRRRWNLPPSGCGKSSPWISPYSLQEAMADSRPIPSRASRSTNGSVPSPSGCSPITKPPGAPRTPFRSRQDYICRSAPRAECWECWRLSFR